jgi:predicted thioesterase
MRRLRDLAMRPGFRGLHPVTSAILLRRSAMSTISGLTPGLKGSAELVVGEQHTAPKVGSGRVHVLATPVMINLIEAAALAAVEHLLPPGQQSLGTHLDVRHFAATPVGMRVSAEAELTKIDGRLLTFRVSAADAIELIGDGTHERMIVTLERFDQRVQKKVAQIR